MDDKTLNIDVKVIYHWYDTDKFLEQEGFKDIIKQALEEGDFKTFSKYYYAYNFDFGWYLPSVAEIIYKNQSVGNINILTELGFSLITENIYNGEKK